jgi:hypothetical protein
MVVEMAVRKCTGPVVLDIGDDIGALIVYTSEQLVGREIEVSPIDNAARRTHTEVLERRFGGQTVYSGVFPALTTGEYSLWRDVLTDQRIAVPPASVAEVDWRDVSDATDFRLAQPDQQALDTQRPYVLPDGSRDLLPARYRDGEPVRAEPMGSAPLILAESGDVAWDLMWTSYCDLALAGGPKHRDTLLEPVSPADALAAEDTYNQVLFEIERGLRLVTGRSTERSDTPGWVGLRCEDELMARWLVRAIAVENVSVRREGVVIFLPAAPTFRLEQEIKNVVTVVAKTYHYWSEHRLDQAPVHNTLALGTAIAAT